MIIPNAETFSIGAADSALVSSGLGNTTRIAHTKSGNVEALERRVGRYDLQTQAARLLLGERVGLCLKQMTAPARGVEVIHHADTQSANFRGLMVCGSVWSCPICAARITEKRRIELSGGVDSWRAKGGGVALASFTLRHSHDDRLKPLRADLAKAWRYMSSAREFQRLKGDYQIIGSVSSFEVTHGASGWHTHKHALFFTARTLTEGELLALEGELARIWLKQLARVGRDGLSGVAVRVSSAEASEAAAAYVTKWSITHELVKSPVKRGREGGLSPFELLADSLDNPASGRLFKEYFFAMKGSHQLQFTRGLRELLGLGEQATDAELAAAETDETAQVILTIPAEIWREVCRLDLRGEIIRRASAGDGEALQLWLCDELERAGAPPGQNQY